MTPATTVKMLACRSELASQEIAEEAQHLLDLYNSPDVDECKKAEVKKGLDKMIRDLESKVETRRTVRGNGSSQGA